MRRIALISGVLMLASACFAASPNVIVEDTNSHAMSANAIAVNTVQLTGDGIAVTANREAPMALAAATSLPHANTNLGHGPNNDGKAPLGNVLAGMAAGTGSAMLLYRLSTRHSRLAAYKRSTFSERINSTLAGASVHRRQPYTGFLQTGTA